MMDVFNRDDFDETEYINERFPDEASLEGLDDEIARISLEIERLDAEILNDVREQTLLNKQTRAELDGAQALAQSLIAEIRDIREKALETEAAVEEMCRDIRTLDIAKKNITTGINCLRKFADLSDSLTSLKQLLEEGAFATATQTLLTINDLSAFFQPYESVASVAALIGEKNSAVRVLKLKLQDEFALYLRGMSSRSAAMLREACQLVDAVGADFRKTIVNGVLENIMKTYNDQFSRREQKTLASLDRRFAWLETALTEFSSGKSAAFLPSWAISCYIAHEFCGATSVHINEILSNNSPEEGRVLVLIAAMKKTVAFEHELQQKLQAEHGESIGIEITRLKGVLSRPFENHTAAYTEQEGRDLREAVEREWQSERERRERLADGAEELNVLPSALVLFARTKGMLDRASKISRGPTLVEVVRCSRRVIAYYISELAAQIARDETALRKNDKTERRCILNFAVLLSTFDYVREMLSKLYPTVVNLVDEPYAHGIDFSEEETFSQRAALEVVNALGRYLETRVEALLLNGQRPSPDVKSVVTAFAETLCEHIPSIFFARILKVAIEIVNSRLSEALLRLKRPTLAACEQFKKDAEELQNAIIALNSSASESAMSAVIASAVEQGRERITEIVGLLNASDASLESAIAASKLSLNDIHRALAVRGMKKSEAAILIDKCKQ